MKRINKIILAVVMAIVITLFFGACSTPTTNSVMNDQNQTNTQLSLFQKNQPVPVNDWSQYRQTAIDVEQAQIHGMATTTFFFNQGNPVPFKTCPSIGYPVASTAQLTNPDQIAINNNYSTLVDGVVGQQEPNGVYTGPSEGTYVVCVQPNGTKYITYWEGFVHTEGGPAHFDKASGQVVMDGAPTVVAKTR